MHNTMERHPLKRHLNKQAKINKGADTPLHSVVLCRVYTGQAGCRSVGAGVVSAPSLLPAVTLTVALRPGTLTHPSLRYLIVIYLTQVSNS